MCGAYSGVSRHILCILISPSIFCDMTSSVSLAQVTENTAKLLMGAGYECECRGPTYVKGKGTLTTYFVKTPFDEK